jgi:hypothetical protein
MLQSPLKAGRNVELMVGTATYKHGGGNWKLVMVDSELGPCREYATLKSQRHPDENFWMISNHGIGIGSKVGRGVRV